VNKVIGKSQTCHASDASDEKRDIATLEEAYRI
jgi:hypothetical protein